MRRLFWRWVLSRPKEAEKAGAALAGVFLLEALTHEDLDAVE